MVIDTGPASPAFPNNGEGLDDGLTKLQWAAVQVAAQLATVMPDASPEEIARRANEIACRVLEFSAP